ncbi:hypothetical protein [Alkalihalobacillus sp. AL-G]|uniref:hypothetical protein n=1 Tax=Alkalihalobacillus sp. AL-G TaxID=2926399 RepID=UPI00272AA3F6|nr:hypothetical protein [Alkalihalobacillus sp. AL-G]WLD92829.1 hypothetical protein MOJ78_17750 [Alkalihalobacillus sp. AL-G]
MTKQLDSLKFSYLHHTLVGSLKSCIDYLNIDVSEEWLYGMSSVAFLIATDKKVSTDAVAYGYDPGMIFRLVENVGIRVRGIHRAEDPVDRDGLLSSAWDYAKHAIDNNYPCFSFELEEGHEHAIIFGYDGKGYLSHGWHHRGTESIPWKKLGQQMCPCERCQEQRMNSEEQGNARFIDLHWVEPTPNKVSVLDAFQQMLSVLFQINDHRSWVYKGCAVGLAAYDNLIDTVDKGTVIGKNLGYNLDVYSEARRRAPLFLNEVTMQIPAVPAELSGQAIDAYQTVSDRLKHASELYPWKQPFEPIGINEESQKASRLLKEAKDAEATGLNALREIYEKMQKVSLHETHL